MKTASLVAGSLLVSLIAPVATFGQADSDTQAAKQWVVYEGKDGPGKGKHIVFVSGDDEYRSEEALPQLAKIAAVRHGFKCTVLFAINPETGLIQPDYQTNIPGTSALDTADLMVIATRFRDLPDDQMEPIDNYLKRGGPVVGLRTATHAFNMKRNSDSRWKHYGNGYGGEKEGWKGGFGRLVLGEKWISHHGRHKDESARGVVDEGAKEHPIARGLSKSDIWGPSDVYGIRLNALSDTFKPIVLGMVVKRDGKRDNKDPFYGMRPSDKEINKGKSEPAMPIAWVKDYQLPEGKKGRAFNTTMGAATDIVSEGTRKMICNGMYWAMGMEDKIPDQGTQVGIVGEFKPTAFGFGTFRKNLKVSDFEMKAKQPAARRDGIGPRADIPQLKVLNHFAGRWVEEVTIGDDTVTARGKAEWVLGGTHLRSEFEIDTEGAKTHHMAVMGWDPVRETYCLLYTSPSPRD